MPPGSAAGTYISGSLGRRWSFLAWAALEPRPCYEEVADPGKFLGSQRNAGWGDEKALRQRGQLCPNFVAVAVPMAAPAARKVPDDFQAHPARRWRTIDRVSLAPCTAGIKHRNASPRAEADADDEPLVLTAQRVLDRIGDQFARHE